MGWLICGTGILVLYVKREISEIHFIEKFQTQETSIMNKMALGGT